MKELAIFLSNSLQGWLVIQVIFMFVFLWYLQTYKKSILPDKELPKTAVILCLRGVDPYLPNCLRSLLNQNYPQYDLKLIVDSQEDPAWKVATDIIQQQKATNVQIDALRIIRKNCSLKCSSLVQAVSELDHSYQVVALVDADTVPHPNWLRELVSPLTHPKIGVTTGNRWYIPTGKYWGSLVRYIGNLSAVVQMYIFGIPWGGSLAVKTELLRQTELVDKWGQAFEEDKLLCKILKKEGLRVKFVPSAILLNREECELPTLVDSLTRLLLSSRLYSPSWSAAIGDAISSILFPTLALLLFAITFLIGDWELAVMLFRSYVTYTVGLLFMMLTLEFGVRSLIRQNGEQLPTLPLTTIIKMLIATPLTQWVYGIALLSSFSSPTIKWRGITYRIKGPWNIRLVEYRPYHLLDQPVDSKVSL